MQADPSPLSGRSEWRGGWPVVVAAMLGIGTNAGLFQNLSSLFVPGIEAEFGWSRGDIATAAGIGLIGALFVPLLGRVADRVGARPMIIAAMLLLGAIYLGMTAITGSIWQYQLLVFGLALSVPGTSSLVYGKLIAARFVRGRGMALAVATSGLSITTLALPPVIGMAIAAGGWRAGFVTLAVITSVIALPLVLLAIRGVHAGPTRPAPDSAAAEQPVAGLTAAEARRSGRFWRLSCSALLVNLATVGLVTQLVPFGIDRGLTPGGAALLLTAYGGSQVVGRLAMGVLIDRFRPQTMAAGVGVISAISFAGLVIDAPGLPLMMALVFGAGLMSGADNDVLPFFGIRLFGLRAFGEVYGMLVTIALVGTATGIVGYGRLHDLTGDYEIALAIGSGAMLLAAILFLTLKDAPLPIASAAAHPAESDLRKMGR